MFYEDIIEKEDGSIIVREFKIMVNYRVAGVPYTAPSNFPCTKCGNRSKGGLHAHGATAKKKGGKAKPGKDNTKQQPKPKPKKK